MRSPRLRRREPRSATDDPFAGGSADCAGATHPAAVERRNRSSGQARQRKGSRLGRWVQVVDSESGVHDAVGHWLALCIAHLCRLQPNGVAQVDERMVGPGVSCLDDGRHVDHQLWLDRDRPAPRRRQVQGDSIVEIQRIPHPRDAPDSGEGVPRKHAESSEVAVESVLSADDLPAVDPPLEMEGRPARECQLVLVARANLYLSADRTASGGWLRLGR